MITTKPIDIEDAHADILQNAFKKHLPEGVHVYAFGSRANWQAKRASDLDLAVDANDAIKRNIGNLEEELSLSALPYKVDIVNLSSMSDSFRRAIMNDLVPILWDWEEVTLGKVITLQRGHDLAKSKMLDGIIPVAGSNGIIGHHNTATTKAIGITIGRSGNLGNAYLYKTDFWAHNTTLYVKNFKNNDEIFIYYILKNIDFKSFNVGSAVPTLNRNHIHPLAISLPPLPEQKAIASLLSSLDDKIDLLHRQNKTLESIAEVIFRKWFIEDADDSWEEKSLNNVANYLNGLACQKYPPKNNFDKLPVLKIKELRGGINKDSDRATSNIEKKYIVQEGDIIFSWSGSLLVKIWDGEPCILNQHLFKVTSTQYSKWFFYLWTKYHLIYFISLAESKATTMGHIKKSDLDNAIVTIPSNNEIKHMDKTMKPIIDKIIVNNMQIKTLESLRNTLLPKLMSGSIRVKYEAS